jgi:hypothetical protein
MPTVGGGADGDFATPDRRQVAQPYAEVAGMVRRQVGVETDIFVENIIK